MDAIIVICVMFGVLTFIAAVTLSIFAAFHVFKNGNCEILNKKRKATVSSKVCEWIIIKLFMY